LIGEVDCLTEPLVAFIRLQKAILLPDLTEVCVPTRFIFIQLGPVGNQHRYHEVGRSIATLMSDEVTLYLHCLLIVAGIAKICLTVFVAVLARHGDSPLSQY